MSLYPSLEDMQIDKLVKAQNQILNQSNQQQNEMMNYPKFNSSTSTQSSLSLSNQNSNIQLYPDIQNFLGMELTESMIKANMSQFVQEGQIIPQQPQQQQLQQQIFDVNTETGLKLNTNMIAPLSGNATISERANVTHGIREIILCKDANGKIGLRVQACNNGIFVSIVVKDSPAALAGLRFGDQILQLNGQLLAGYTVDKVHKLLKNSPQNNISMIIRDRPFERTITLFKDSHGSVGFQFENGKIISIVKDSSAARNGLLTDHNLLEINGQTVVAMKDKDIKKIIHDSDKIIKITIIPSFIYEHMIKKLSTSFLRGIMDHSIPEF